MSGRWLKIAAVALSSAVAASVALVPATSAEQVKRPAITIQSNDQFDAEHGIKSGSGTASDPFVISGWRVNSIRIENTDRHVVITDNTVAGKMILNWIGDRAHVHDNVVGDLRVNQNVRRTGLPTSGVIAQNAFGIVGQLRHWDGVFERNVIGARNALGSRAVNFDGFNGARFRNNTIYGYMDARLHGHHHSSAYGAGSHQHSGEHHAAAAVDHTRRYHQVRITGNAISTTAPFALAYLDTNHAANDRTAASEQEPSLRLPHVHHTRVLIAGNRLAGAGLMVNVFNALDKQKHLEFAEGLVELRDNTITLAKDGWSRDLFGIEVKQARYLTLLIDGNSITGRPSSNGIFELFDNSKDAGIYLHTLDVGDVRILHNRVTERSIGVRAEQFTKDVRWVIDDLRTKNVESRVTTDDTVQDSPNA
ncbi:MAG TPA: hypothetical protein VFA34_01140 [Actinomycetota bacterium]|nr:hypothetical protein [Actinomycetota bacterium]